eukprot:TRINITY_DN26897_c0_g1_i1.p1 TRINITY_DN26897_c0_g1~~TRINITY_DN26897_c0_g1_i1.p1  ORF type:complete len:492 (+),score=95.63 TRINITY_DN26897_c0_g1_i1:168-1643(+)
MSTVVQLTESATLGIFEKACRAHSGTISRLESCRLGISKAYPGLKQNGAYQMQVGRVRTATPPVFRINARLEDRTEAEIDTRCEASKPSLPFSSSQRSQSPSPSPLWRQAQTSVAAIALTLLQALSPLDMQSLQQPTAFLPLAPAPAEAVLFSPDVAKLPRTGEVALRRAIPAVNLTMKKVQGQLEEIFYFLRIPQRKPYGSMEGNVKSAIQSITADKAAILAAVPKEYATQGEDLYDRLLNGKGALEGLLAAVELRDSDKIADRLVATLDTIGELEALQAPGLPYLISAQFNDLPRLTGRAVAEFTLLKADGSNFASNGAGGQVQSGVVEMTLDGYSAPLTAGNFANLVRKGAYNGVALKATPQAVLGEGASQLGRELPLEILPAGEIAPLYRTALDVQDGEIPVLPMSVFGSVAMSHSTEADNLSHPSQFFVYLYDKRNSGLGGLSFDEGQFAVFGYVTKGKEILQQLKTGDVIESARLLSGFDKLVIP